MKLEALFCWVRKAVFLTLIGRASKLESRPLFWKEVIVLSQFPYKCRARQFKQENQAVKLLQPKIFVLLAGVTITAQLLAACAPVVPAPTHEPTMSHPSANTTTSTGSTTGIDPLVFKQAVLKLWEDHVTRTCVYIIAALAGLPEADTAAQRLLQNQADLGNAIKPFYGDQAGEQLTSLLKDHILTAADLLTAAKSGNNTKFKDANTRWYENANQIAAFLNSANPDH